MNTTELVYMILGCVTWLAQATAHAGHHNVKRHSMGEEHGHGDEESLPKIPKFIVTYGNGKSEACVIASFEAIVHSTDVLPFNETSAVHDEVQFGAEAQLDEGSTCKSRESSNLTVSSDVPQGSSLSIIFERKADAEGTEVWLVKKIEARLADDISLETGGEEYFKTTFQQSYVCLSLVKVTLRPASGTTLPPDHDHGWAVTFRNTRFQMLGKGESDFADNNNVCPADKRHGEIQAGESSKQSGSVAPAYIAIVFALAVVGGIVTYHLVSTYRRTSYNSMT